MAKAEDKIIAFKLKNYAIKRAFIYFALSLSILLINCFSSNAEDLRIHFIDVGEGDSILIQTPENNTILIDTGNLITGFKLMEFLKENDIDSLEYLIFTHPDLDHIGGAFFILQMMKIRKIYDNGQDLTNAYKPFEAYRWYQELTRSRDNYGTLSAGDEIVLDGVSLNVLWPPKQFVSSDFNTNSLVMILSYKNFKCLLAGDITIDVEREIIKKNVALKADVLKVAHHGSGAASSKEFINMVSPKLSIISINKDNIRDYPSRNVWETLKAVSSKVYCTSINGNIVLNVKGDDAIGVLTEK